MKKILYLYIMCATALSFSQKTEELDSLPTNINDYIFVKPGDSITIQFSEFTLFPKHKFKSQEDVRYYLWLRRKVFKAYPYAKLASERLDSLNTRLNRIESNRGRKRYTRLIQNYIENEFTDQIKKMTKTEGRILIKLIHRQTGQTAFNNIKDLRSGWNAFWYNTTANIFKLSLKMEYHPESVNEDFLIEDILQRAFQDAKLEKQVSKIPIDFTKIIVEKKSEVDVEEYKRMFAKMMKKGKVRNSNNK